MTRKLSTALFLLFIAPALAAQGPAVEKRAVKMLSKRQWDHARALLHRAIRKEPVSPGAEYLLARYFFDPLNPRHNIDSAYHHITSALDELAYAAPKTRDRLGRLGIDSVSMVTLRTRIDSADFERARRLNTEQAFLTFLERYPHSHHRSEAQKMRDEAAFADAVRENTHEAFFDFYTKYPDASRSEEALEHYHRLLYETRTRSRTLSSFEAFIAEYPSTPYRHLVEKNIFEISTAGGEVRDFLNFMQKYPGSSFARRARNILFHILAETEGGTNAVGTNDSLRRIKALNSDYLVPVLEKDSYVLIDRNGKVNPHVYLDAIPSEYLCGNITDDILITNGRLISRDGAVIFSDSIDSVDDIGSGFLVVKGADPCPRLLHKSGFTIRPCVAEAKIVARRFIAGRDGKDWWLASLAGKILTDQLWDSISSIDNLVVLGKEGKYRIATARSVAASANGEPIPLTPPFDEVRAWSPDLIWYRSGNAEGLLDTSLREILRSLQPIRQAFFGAIASDGRESRLIDKKGEEILRLSVPEINEPWVAGKTLANWMLLRFAEDGIRKTVYDSVFFTGPFAVGVQRDSLEISFDTLRRIRVPLSARPLSIPGGRDSNAFLIVTHERKKTIYNFDGQHLFTTDADEIQYAGDGLFIITRRGKRGVCNALGRIVLPVEYDGVGTAVDGILSLLKNMQFGAYSVRQNILIKPAYRKNLIRYNERLLAAYNDGKYHFIGWDRQRKGSADFDEVQYWTDSTALIRRGSSWSLFDPYTSKIRESGITAISYIRDELADKLAVVRQDDAYGVLSNRNGFIIPATFTRVVNVGSATDPLYFTEKHVEEAAIHVVIYYDEKGKLLLRRVYEEDEYEKIMCPDD